MAKSKEIWSTSVEGRRQGYKTCVEWFLERKPLNEETLQQVRRFFMVLYFFFTCDQIKVPIKIIHCIEDVAYPLDCSVNLMMSLQRAGNSQASLHEVPGAHHGNITNPKSYVVFHYASPDLLNFL